MQNKTIHKINQENKENTTVLDSTSPNGARDGVGGVGGGLKSYSLETMYYWQGATQLRGT